MCGLSVTTLPALAITPVTGPGSPSGLGRAAGGDDDDDEEAVEEEDAAAEDGGDAEEPEGDDADVSEEVAEAREDD